MRTDSSRPEGSQTSLLNAGDLQFVVPRNCVTTFKFRSVILHISSVKSNVQFYYGVVYCAERNEQIIWIHGLGKREAEADCPYSAGAGLDTKHRIPKGYGYG